MKQIQLANNKGVALVSDKHFGLVSEHKWQISPKENTSYAVTTIYRNGKRTSIRMHRLIMGEPQGKQIDHIDGNGLNNQISNLRICTNSQNHMNQRTIRGVSQYKGVCRDRGKWRAYITKDWKYHYLGRHDSEIEAAKIYDEAARELFGEFANTNF